MTFLELAHFYSKRSISLLKHAGVKTFVQRLLTLMGPLRTILIRYHQGKSKHNPAINIGSTQFESIDSSRILNNLKTHGFSLGINLSQSTTNAILEFAHNTPVDKESYENVYVHSKMDESPIRGIRTYPYNSPHTRCDSIRQIAYDNSVIDIVSSYLGIQNPILFSSKLYWSFPNHESKTNSNYSPQYFHFDVSDSKALTLFFYLSDVDITSGPHVVVKGTNTNRSIFNILNWKISDKKAERIFASRIETIIGPKGTGFFEDLLNYHKHAFASHKNPRLMLALTYVIQRKA